MSSSINIKSSEDVHRDCSIDITEDSEPHPDSEPNPDQFCIYRVPKSIRKGKQEAYTPQIVSIGPLHHGREDLKDMEGQKEKYVEEFFKRPTSKEREEVFVLIQMQEQDIRKCYSETCQLESENDQMYFPENPKEEMFKKEFKHFTDMQRAALVGDFERKKSAFQHLHCATKLQESGVKFRCASEEGSPLKIKFEQDELRIPELSVFHETDTILRNIMALEQCCYQGSLVVCSYVQLLDFLIEDKRDAQLFVDEGIIRNWMGDSKALANLFNKLCVEIPFVENHYLELFQELEGHYSKRRNRNKARLINVYFGDIWKGTATVAAAIILVLTFTQTMYNVKEWIY